MQRIVLNKLTCVWFIFKSFSEPYTGLRTILSLCEIEGNKIYICMKERMAGICECY